MKKSTLILLVVLLVLTGFFLYNKQGVNSMTANAVNEGVQEIVLSEKNLNYYPNEIKVKEGQPVSITLDSSVVGCLRSFTIKDFGVSKYVKTPQETIDFTPTKKGTFGFSCVMGMGYGKIIVE